eukprot:9160232-Heterocapsa_arctica.AAC.1
MGSWICRRRRIRAHTPTTASARAPAPVARAGPDPTDSPATWRASSWLGHTNRWYLLTSS